MLKYYKRIPTTDDQTDVSPPSKRPTISTREIPVQQSSSPTGNGNSSIEICGFDFSRLPEDPGLRPHILSYPPNVRDQIRRYYLMKGPCQPKNHIFPAKKKASDNARRFNPNWFMDFADWLEYSISKDKLFCLSCYLFKSGGADNFVNEGFSSWKKKERLLKHVGVCDSFHNAAKEKCDALLKQEQHIETIITKQTDESQRKYEIRLGASIQTTRILLRQGLAFRGDDEGEGSTNKGNFLELLGWLGRNNKKEIEPYILDNAPRNVKLISPVIQKDIASAISYEIISSIVSDIGDSCFSILVDESKDVSNKEQMAIVLRYVSEAKVIERFVGIEHVTSTTAISLKETIDNFFSRHGLSVSMLRGQGYDGANNMRGEYNGLKKLIMDENDCAYYIHCFAHQLQLAVIGVAKKDPEIGDLFSLVTCVTTIVGGSPKRLEILRELRGAELLEALNNGELETGQGLNQETNLKRASDTRWGSHHYTLISLINLFSPVRGVLKHVSKDLTSDKRFEALGLLKAMKLYGFVFRLHLMKNILGITSDLSEALQKKDQDIVNAMKLVSICKQRLQQMRDRGWDSLLAEVALFCEKHGINIVTMEGDVSCSATGRPLRHIVHEKTVMHKYRVDIFNAVIDMQLRELNDRFTETTTDLLLCVACLNPSEFFSAFDKDRLVRLAEFYPRDFTTFDRVLLDDQLQNYIIDMRSSVEFLGLNGIADLAKIMYKSKKDRVYPLVYRLLTLTLILPVATASVERLFSAMKILKNRLRNRMGDEWMNDCLLAYAERDILDIITDDMIMRRFQNMKTRRGRLPLRMGTS